MSGGGKEAVARTMAYLRSGPRLRLPPEVTGLKVHFQRSGPGMSGARAFLRREVPKLKYTNPAVKIERRILTEQGGAFLTVTKCQLRMLLSHATPLPGRAARTEQSCPFRYRDIAFPPSHATPSLFPPATCPLSFWLFGAHWPA